MSLGHAEERINAQQIVTLLRQIEVSIGQVKSAPIACRDAGISLQSYYRWRKEYGGVCTKNLNPHIMMMKPAKDWA